MMQEKFPDAGYILRIGIPYGFVLVERGYEMDVRADISYWVRTAEIVLLYILSFFKQLVFSTFTHTKVRRHIARRTLQHLQSIQKLILLSAQQDVEVRGERMRIEARDKERLRLSLR